jgi:outer membrane protein assembly factor BamD (BamD/ComL family)
MRKPFPLWWIQKYNTAFRNYVQGNWGDAVSQFKEVLTLHPKDKPTTLVLEFMAQTDNEPPADWQGFKYLEE